MWVLQFAKSSQSPNAYIKRRKHFRVYEYQQTTINIRVEQDPRISWNARSTMVNTSSSVPRLEKHLWIQFRPFLRAVEATPTNLQESYIFGGGRYLKIMSYHCLSCLYSWTYSCCKEPLEQGWHACGRISAPWNVENTCMSNTALAAKFVYVAKQLGLENF